MRVLFMPAPAIGHTFPMVPLAWAFRSAGHDVVFVTGADALAVADAGLPVVNAIPGITGQQMLTGFARDLPDLFAPFDGPLIEAMAARKPGIVASWDPYVDAHVRAASATDPDLVVYDPIFAVGGLVAALLDVPAVAHGSGFSRFAPELVRVPPASVAFERYGLRLPEGIKTIDVVPPSLVEGPPSELAMRYVPYNGGGVLPDWLREPSEKPRVAVTFGSLLGALNGPAFAKLIAGIATEVDAEFVLALGGGADRLDDAVLAALPANVRLTGWVPLNALLATCAAAIHHGGDGSAMACCALGVPQLALPQGPPLQVNAEWLRRRGAALVCSSEELTTATVHRLLVDDRLREVAGEVRAEITALPSPAEVARELVELCQSARIL